MKTLFRRTSDILNKNINYYYDHALNDLDKLLVNTYRYHDSKINRSDFEHVFEQKFKMGWDINNFAFLLDDRMYERYLKIISYKGKMDSEKLFLFLDKLKTKINSKKIIIDTLSTNIQNYNQFEKFTKKIENRVVEIYNILSEKPNRDNDISFELFKMFCYDNVVLYCNIFKTLFRTLELD